MLSPLFYFSQGEVCICILIFIKIMGYNYNKEGDKINKKYKHVFTAASRILLMILGSALASVGLEKFLIPNNIMDGGVTGISIMSSHFTSNSRYYKRYTFGNYTWSTNYTSAGQRCL